jgi:hypothetical protein
MSDQTLTCPECKNTSPAQPIDVPIWCIRDDKHKGRFYVQMEATKEETK